MEDSFDSRHETDNATNDTSQPSEPLAVRVTVPILFSVIFIVGLIGNGTLIYTVVKNSSMHTKPNVLIVTLAIGDFLFILVSVPFTSTIYTFDEWYYGSTVCKLNQFMQTLSLGVSVFTLAALSVDRFIAIVYPFTAYCSITMTKIITAAVVIWVISISLALLDIVGADVRPCSDCSRYIETCSFYPPEWGEGYKEFRLIFRLVVYFLLPVAIIATLYSLIACALLCQPSDEVEFGPGGNGGTSANARRIELRKRVAKVVLSFVLIFIVCWLPRNFYVLYYQFSDNYSHDTWWHVFKISTFCLCFIYSAVNPFALYILNDDYRQYFRYYLFRRCNPRWRRLPTGRLNSLQDTAIRYSVV